MICDQCLVLVCDLQAVALLLHFGLTLKLLSEVGMPLPGTAAQCAVVNCETDWVHSFHA